MDKPDLANLPDCIEDVRQAVLDSDAGPGDPRGYCKLRRRLKATREKLPPLYRKTVFDPFIRTLDELGSTGFTKILESDPSREDLAGVMLDIAQAILQHGKGYDERATGACQEVVSDLYDGFLSAEDRRGVKPPDKSVIPPLVKWGSPQSGPYTWPVNVTSAFGLQVAVVNLPAAYARRGLLSWVSLSHETAGHGILNADTGLLQELKQAVLVALEGANLKQGLPGYWSFRIEEAASDVLGILNIGPAGGIGLIGSFRGRNAARAGIPKLSNEGAADNPHPADILRGFLASSTVRLLDFDGANHWADRLAEETARDVSSIRLDGIEVSEKEACQSAEIVAKTLVHSKMGSLEGHSLGEIQDWRNRDEEIVEQLRSVLNTAGGLPASYASGIYAAHAVAAAVTAAVSKGVDRALLFDRMLTVLKTMHDKNPSWGPLFVAHPGDIVPRKVHVD